MIQEDFSKYNGEGTKLRQAQICMLNIMVEVDKICRKNNIPYWLDSGTLIGAVRHGGFIPWDDDIDICILEKDYKRLREALIKELPSRYILCDSKTDAYFFETCYYRVKDTYTSCDYPLFYKQKSQGLWIDIIPLIPATPKWYKSGVEYIYGRVSREIHNFSTSKGLPKWQCLLNKTIAYLLYPIAYILRIIGNIWAKCCNNQELMFNWGSCFNSRRYLNEVFPLSKIEFENHKFYAPCNTHAYLQRIYGDYMKLPEKSKRQIHMDVESMKFNIHPSDKK